MSARITVTDEMRVRAAKAMADDWNPERDPILTAMFRDYAASALEAVAPLIAAQALEDARDAGATELLKLLIAEDDAQYIGGSSQGIGPIEAYETAENWLDSRATKLREGVTP